VPTRTAASTIRASCCAGRRPRRWRSWARRTRRSRRREERGGRSPCTSAWSSRERLRCGDTPDPYGGDMAMETTPTRRYEGQAVRGTALQLCDFGSKHGRTVALDGLASRWMSASSRVGFSVHFERAGITRFRRRHLTRFFADGGRCPEPFGDAAGPRRPLGQPHIAGAAASWMIRPNFAGSLSESSRGTKKYSAPAGSSVTSSRASSPRTVRPCGTFFGSAA
jgi:hypothetical protein